MPFLLFSAEIIPWKWHFYHYPMQINIFIITIYLAVKKNGYGSTQLKIIRSNAKNKQATASNFM
jgi:hypothetical protein